MWRWRKTSRANTASRSERSQRAASCRRGRGALSQGRARALRDAMFDDIYNQKILELAANIPRLGRLPAPQASASAHSRLCGSSITIDLSLADGRVSDYAQEVKACALGQAASSVMGRHIIGAAPAELRALARDHAQDAERERPAAAGPLRRRRRAGAGARLQGAPRFDPAGVRRRGRGSRQDRASATPPNRVNDLGSMHFSAREYIANVARGFALDASPGIVLRRGAPRGSEASGSPAAGRTGGCHENPASGSLDARIYDRSLPRSSKGICSGASFRKCLKCPR